MSMYEKALQFRKATQFAYKGNETVLDNKNILSMASIYDYWSANSVRYEKDKSIVKVIENGEDVLYKCISSHTSQENRKPSQLTASLWQRIDLDHAGTLEDPIPAAVNMIYYNGKYYIENGTIYKCTRDSGIALQYLPSQLVGQYFEAV